MHKQTNNQLTNYMQRGLTLLLFFCTSICISQNITLKGTVTDPDDFPLESATIYLTTVKDSSVVEYTISDNGGKWEMKVRENEEPIDLKISYIGFSDYKQRLNSIKEDKDFGIIKLKDLPTELSEITIEGEVPPIRIKSDTLEFNASSFKVRPDANVEALLKQLPGVEIDAEGKITVNGKEVNQILVNGKPFFDQDGKIALQNLPAEIIDKVQVSDTKTKKEELTGRAASSDNASINLTIQDDKNKGLFGKFMGGYGTDDRYESSALVNYFKDKRKISLLASSNNINSTGFSMNEIFDSMGGGRTTFFNSSNGSFGINGMRFGGGNGITRSNLFGINYADEWIDNLDSNVSYFFTNSNSDNINRTRLVTFLPTEDTDETNTERSNITESTAVSKSISDRHNFNTEFEYEIDSTATVSIRPRFSRTNAKTTTDSQQNTRNQDNELLNESDSYTLNDANNIEFSNAFNYSKTFSNKKRYLSFSFDNRNQVNDAANYNSSSTFFYNNENDEPEADIRNQVIFNRRIQDAYTTEIEYSEPVTDSLQIIASIEHRYDKTVEDRDGFNYSASDNNYSVFNDLLTNYMSSAENAILPKAGIALRKEKIRAELTGGTNIIHFNNYASYLGEDYNVNRDFILPYADMFLSYRMSKSKSIYANYRYNVNLPNGNQILPVEDLSNPLFTEVGNPDLDPNKTHNFYFSYRNYDYQIRSGYGLYGGGNYNDSQIIANTIISNSAKRTATYTNVSDTYNFWLGSYWSKSIKKDEHKFRFRASINSNHTYSKGFTNQQLYEAWQYSISPRFNFTWEYGELLTINPSYNFSYNETQYNNFTIDATSYSTHNFNLQTTSYWPKHFVFGNDFGYTYNTNLGAGFRRDFYLWNTSLGYNFFDDKLLFKVKVYDVLNQNIGTSRTVTATSVYDQENTVLQRYVMFSLTYKIQKFGGKKEGSNRIHFW